MPHPQPITVIFVKNFPCGKCDLPVFPHHKALCCDSNDCDKWYHLKCTKVSMLQYKEFTSRHYKGTWICTPCLAIPFSGLTNTEFLATVSHHVFDNSSFPDKCALCSKKINQNKKNKCLPCRTCDHLVHRKCSGIPLSSLNALTRKDLNNWECINCLSEKFPFVHLNSTDLLHLSFNSNFDCPCNNQCLTKINSFDNFRLDLHKFVDKENEKFYIGPDPFSNLDKSFEVKINFKYYENHQFHKLTTAVSNKNNFFTLSH